MAQQTVSELTQRLMDLFEEKGKNLSWPKREMLAMLKEWREELSAEGERLGEVLSRKGSLGLTEVTAVFKEFANWQKDRHQEADKWQRELSALSKKRLAIKGEVERIIGQFEMGAPTPKKEGKTLSKRR